MAAMAAVLCVTAVVPAQNDDCPLELPGRQMLGEMSLESFSDIAFSTNGSHDRERAFALSLPGVDEGYLAFVFLAMTCSGPLTYDRYCEGEFGGPGEGPETFWQGRDRCSQLGCISTEMDTARLWFTELPHRDSDDLHPFRYASLRPAGDVLFDPNPQVLWVYDRTVPDEISVSADIARNVLFTPEGGGTLDLSHEGKLKGVHAGDEVRSVALTLEFPRLLTSGPLSVKISGGPDAIVTGIITQGEKVLATLSGTFGAEPPLEFDWSGCGGAARFRRGDATADGSLNITDAIAILLHLFQGGPIVPCEDSADVNDDGKVDLADPVGLLRFLFQEGDAPPAPFPDPGPDPTADALDCARGV